MVDFALKIGQGECEEVVGYIAASDTNSRQERLSPLSNRSVINQRGNPRRFSSGSGVAPRPCHAKFHENNSGDFFRLDRLSSREEKKTLFFTPIYLHPFYLLILVTADRSKKTCDDDIFLDHLFEYRIVF